MKLLQIERRLFIFLLYYAPWANIVNLRISPAFAYLPFVFVFISLGVINLFVPSKLKHSDTKLIVNNSIYFMLLFVQIAFYIFTQSFNSYFLFFNLFAFLLLSLLFLFDMRLFSIDDVSKYASYLVVIIVLSIVIDYILIEFGVLVYQPMYRAEAYSYLTRPFGIFGQPSVNSSILCFLFLIKRYLSTTYYNNRSDKKYFLLVLIGVFLQGSGSGFVSFVIMLIPIVIPFFRRIKYIVLFLFIYLLYYLVIMEVVDKISISYLLFLYDYGLIVWHSYTDKIVSVNDVLFGLPEKVNDITIDYGPLFYVSHMGILLFVGFTITLGILYFKVKNRFFRSAVLLIALSNLHYPVMFYTMMHVFWPLIFFMAESKFPLCINNSSLSFELTNKK